MHPRKPTLGAEVHRAVDILQNAEYAAATHSPSSVVNHESISVIADRSSVMGPHPQQSLLRQAQTLDLQVGKPVCQGEPMPEAVTHSDIHFRIVHD
jgi:hypothetical protein